MSDKLLGLIIMLIFEFWVVSIAVYNSVWLFGSLKSKRSTDDSKSKSKCPGHYWKFIDKENTITGGHITDIICIHCGHKELTYESEK